MQALLSTLKRNAVRQIFTLGLISLMSWMGFLITVSPNGYAVARSQPSSQEQVITPVGDESANREEAYEQAAEIAADPEEVVEHEKELTKEQKSIRGGLLEGAKETVDKVLDRN